MVPSSYCTKQKGAFSTTDTSAKFPLCAACFARIMCLLTSGGAFAQTHRKDGARPFSASSRQNVLSECVHCVGLGIKNKHARGVVWRAVKAAVMSYGAATPFPRHAVHRELTLWRIKYANWIKRRRNWQMRRQANEAARFQRDHLEHERRCLKFWVDC